MATPTPESPFSRPNSWGDLARRAASEPAPEEVDIRVPLRTRLELESLRSPADPVPTPTLWDDLAALVQSGWVRWSLAGGATLSVGLLVAGSRAYREAEAVVSLAGPFLNSF